ncbi:MAG: MFS transporter [Coriobacteriaceae bacterium]|nr:MFS transporter [Coriobacteriaceae bacterium]
MSLTTRTSDSSRKQKAYPWLIVLGCCFMQIGGIGTFVDACGVFYRPAAEGLGITVGDYSAYLTFLFVGTIPSALCVGRLVNRYDIRALVSVNVVICALALAFMGFYPFMWMRSVAGFLFGFCGGFFFMIMSPILINNWFIRRKGLAMGIAMASSGVGAAILSPLITILIAHIGWRYAYVCVAAFVMAAILPWSLLVFRLKPEDKGLKPFGYQADEETALSREQGRLKPGIPSRFAIKTVSYVCACGFVGCIAIFAGYNSHLNAFGQTLGYSALVSSTLLTAVSLGSIAEKLIMGLLYDYIGIYKIIWINCILLACGLLILATQTELWLLYIGAGLFGIQNSLVAVQTPLLIRELFGDRDYSRLYAYTRVGVGALGLLGPILITTIFNSAGSYTPAWLASILIVALAGALVLVARLNKKRYQTHWRDADVRLPDEADRPSDIKGKGLPAR